MEEEFNREGEPSVRGEEGRIRAFLILRLRTEGPMRLCGEFPAFLVLSFPFFSGIAETP
jgi:hypothetical protein